VDARARQLQVSLLIASAVAGWLPVVTLMASPASCGDYGSGKCDHLNPLRSGMEAFLFALLVAGPAVLAFVFGRTPRVVAIAAGLLLFLLSSVSFLLGLQGIPAALLWLAAGVSPSRFDRSAAFFVRLALTAVAVAVAVTAAVDWALTYLLLTHGTHR
jgi:hypothetical protein